MKVVSGLLIIGILGVATAAGPDGTATNPLPADRNAVAELPGKADFEREVKMASEQFEVAKLRYDEATERSRLNYIKILEGNLADLVGDEARAAESIRLSEWPGAGTATAEAKYKKELARVRSLKFHSPKFEYTTYQWENNAAPVKMIHKDEGFCYLADIGGAFDGGAEVARVYIGDDGFWYLHGSTGRGFLVLRAIAVKMTR